jgi:hypothetical protein
MKSMITLVGIIAASAAFPAFAHEQNEDVKAWVDHYFQEVDTQGNGYITKDEFLDHAERKFDAMDGNHDGKLSKQEVIQYKTKEQNDWRHHHHAKRTGGINKPDETMSDKDRPDTNEDDKTNSGNTAK